MQKFCVFNCVRTLEHFNPFMDYRKQAGGEEK